jgi:hypothetical protein
MWSLQRVSEGKNAPKPPLEGRLPEKVKPSTGVSSEIECRRVVAYLDGLLASMRSLREEQKFWLGLGPAFRVRYEDFQGDLAMLRAAYRE